MSEIIWMHGARRVPGGSRAGVRPPDPSLVIGELLGVPDEDRARFQRIASRPLDLSLPPHERTASFRQVHAYMADLATRPGPGAGAGMLGVLAHQHGDELTTDELAAIGHLILRRVPRLRLADPAAEVRLRPFGLVHGVAALPVAR